MAIKKWKRAAMIYCWQYKCWRARPISEAPPHMQLYARVLVRNGLQHYWHVGKMGYRLPPPDSNDFVTPKT